MDERSGDSQPQEPGTVPGSYGRVGDWLGSPPGGYPAPPGGYPAPPGGYPAPPGGYPAPPGYGQPRPRHRRRLLAGFISYLAVAALAAAGGGLAVAFITAGGGSPASASAGLGSGSSGGGAQPGAGASTSISSATVHKVLAAVEPGVVVIDSKLDDNQTATGAAGTGMIISASGLVLTNNHVIAGTNGLTVTVVSTGRTYPARWLGYDKSSDVAVIQLEGAVGLTPVPLGNSAATKVGDGVVAMGNAGGTGAIRTATGAITGLDQAITATDGQTAEHLTGMLQINAQIIRGDSGGPLSTTDGKVIGMDTAASSNFINGQPETGFAIPIDKAMTIARQIIAGKPGAGVHVGSTGFAGVLVPAAPNGGQSHQTSPRAQLQQTERSDGQLPYGGYYQAPAGCISNAVQSGVPQRIAPAASGALVLGALCQTPAAAAGLTAGDVITVAAGQRVSSPASLTGILSHLPSGRKITISWVTPSGRTVTRAIILAQAPPQ